jgi:chromosomal replication initiator protein
VAEELHQDAAAIWAACLDSLEGSASTHKAWLAQTRPVAVVGDTLVLAVPDEFVKEWVEQRYAPTMLASLARIAGRPLGIRVTVREVDDVRDEDIGQSQVVFHRPQAVPAERSQFTDQ